MKRLKEPGSHVRPVAISCNTEFQLFQQNELNCSSDNYEITFLSKPVTTKTSLSDIQKYSYLLISLKLTMNTIVKLI
jgi:hypothetical protein